MDESGLPLETVTVIIDGSTTGVVTDQNGVYTISAAPSDVLVFSFIGFKTQSVVVGDQNQINITLVEDVESLDTVVITGYQDVKRELFTGASQTIKAEDVKLEGVADITRSLQGRAAGVNIQNVSGTFGAAPRVTIRGSSSVLGDTKPLWVIDGVVHEEIVDLSISDLVSGDTATLLGSAVAGLNAADIESFEILKDASATALYGARALNGVVVITTKSGKRNQKPTFNYATEFSIRDIPRYSQYDRLNSQETMSIYRELEAKGWLSLPNSIQGRSGGVYNLMYRNINTYDPSTGGFLLENTPEAKAQFLRQYELVNTDWFSELFKSMPTQTHSISFSGGGESSSNYASFSYFTDGGWTIADRVRRITGNLRSSYDLLGGDLKITGILLGSIRNQTVPGTFDRKQDNLTGSFTREFDINPFNYALYTSRAIRPRDDNGNLEYTRYNWAPFNVIDEHANNSIELNVNDIKFQLQADYKINDNLKYSFLGSARYASSRNEHSVTENSNVAAAYRANETTIVENANYFLFRDPDNPIARPKVVLPLGGILTTRNNELVTYTFRNTIDWDKRFQEDLIGLRVYAGQEYRHADRKDSRNTGYGYQFSRGGTIFTDPDMLRKQILEGNDYFSSQETRQREVTFFTNVSFDYDKKYILKLSGNYEGSNRAGKARKSRWLPTYTIGARWNLDREDFILNSNTISMMALRPSYGLVALLADNASNNLPVFRNSVTDRFDDEDRENFINIEALQNSELTWEKTKEFNLGLDIGLFNNALQFNLDIYNRKGVDLIDFVTTSGVGGQSVKLGNNSEMTTKGIEFQVSSVNINKDDFNWRTTFNISYFDQEITALKQRPTVFDMVSGQGFGNAIGYPKGSLFSFKFEGLNEWGIPTFFFNDPDTDPTQGVNFQKRDDILSFLVYEGPTEANISGGIANNFKYKNWDFGFFISFAAGNKVRLAPNFKSVYSDLDVFSKDFLNRWVGPGDESRTNVPVIPSRTQVFTDIFGGRSRMSAAYNAYNYSTERVADGDFVRMKNIRLGYTLDSVSLSNIGISSMRFGLNVTNPFLIYSDSKLKGQDPEFFRSGGVAFPITASYTFSLNIGF